MTNNTNTSTGVRFGVIAAQHLNQDLVHELFTLHGYDIDYQEAYEQEKKACKSDWDAAMEHAENAAYATIPKATPEEREAFCISHALQHAANAPGPGYKADGYDDYETYRLDRFSETYEANENTYEGTYQGVAFRLSCLGGAYLLWAIDGTVGSANQLCSPCVPNAADLDGGFCDKPDRLAHQCYVVPKDWLADEEVAERWVE